MKFTRTFALPAINIMAYRKELHRDMGEAIAQATMEWLDTVLREIPVWSGASRATFLKLAQEINYAIDITPPAINRTAQGVSQSSGEVVADINKGLYTFGYGTTLPWLIWNEYHNANIEPDPTLFYRVWKEGPYMFQVKGTDAFQRFAEKVKLPAVAPFVRAQRIK